MPFYEYKCGACGETTEALQKINADPLVDCPSCGKPALKKLVSAPAFSLKGTGWYVTDFKDSKAKPKGTGSTASAAHKNESQSDTKADTQSATSTDTKSDAQNSTTSKKTNDSPA